MISYYKVKIWTDWEDFYLSSQSRLSWDKLPHELRNRTAFRQDKVHVLQGPDHDTVISKAQSPTNVIPTCLFLLLVPPMHPHLPLPASPYPFLTQGSFSPSQLLISEPGNLSVLQASIPLSPLTHLTLGSKVQKSQKESWFMLTLPPSSWQLQ